MHLYIITRGIKWAVDRFINDLRGKYLPFKTPANANVQLQTAVRPIQLWEICFPKEYKDIMLNTILLNREVKHKRHGKFVMALRKVLGVDKIPEYKKDQMLPVFKEHIDITAIGVKDDEDLVIEGI